jgi:aminopeptidase N
MSNEPETICLEDYAPADFVVLSIDLDFNLDEDVTRVSSRMIMVRREGATDAAPLHLHGENLKLVSVCVDGRPVSARDYELDDQSLQIMIPTGYESFVLEIENEIAPAVNKALLGLYMSNDFFVTQCEPEGFRRITWSLDRPDVMTTFRTRIEADRRKYPVLLSNGNCIGSGTVGEDRHFSQWEDPHPKPTYLFALVAGDLGVLEDEFRTGSGRDVVLRIFAERGKQERCRWAMESLKAAMKWDEETFGLEYDLDIFMIVAISAFNGGAMENKGLNIFNDKYILADPQTATDLDYENIEGVVAHEYFHNWTGNRITCRDWFQLCLKEGLTVFRDQLFSSDMRSEAVKRIKDVQVLRRAQFAEDAGPLAHPVRPASFVEIDNFFTPTVYEKGAEICRMIHTDLGREGFVRGMKLYCQRHDGEAATVEQFVAAMGDASDKDLSYFLTWYAQSGTPEISSRSKWDEASQTLELTLSQITKPTPDQADKVPLHMPIALGLVGKSGRNLGLQLEGESEPGAVTRILDLDEPAKTFRFVGVPEDAMPSLFRGFSAPVRIVDEVTESARMHLMAHDSDPFNRWEAARSYTVSVIKTMAAAIATGETPQVPQNFIDAIGSVLGDEALDPAFKALALAVPSEWEVALEMDIIRVRSIHEARSFLRAQTGAALAGEFKSTYHAMRSNEPFSPDAASAGRRALGNAALFWLTSTGQQSHRDLALTQFQTSDNMTDTMAALQLISNFEGPQRRGCLSAFFEKWKDEATIVDKWLQLEAMSGASGSLDRVRKLMDHEAFSHSVPNRVNALLSGFAYGNPMHFHTSSGEGWRFIADQILVLDKINPATAAGLCEAFSSWRKFEATDQAKMKAELERILGAPKLSRNLYEIAGKLLGKSG